MIYAQIGNDLLHFATHNHCFAFGYPKPLGLDRFIDRRMVLPYVFARRQCDIVHISCKANFMFSAECMYSAVNWVKCQIRQKAAHWRSLGQAPIKHRQTDHGSERFTFDSEFLQDSAYVRFLYGREKRLNVHRDYCMLSDVMACMVNCRFAGNASCHPSRISDTWIQSPVDYTLQVPKLSVRWPDNPVAARFFRPPEL
jgi:hypothetical protein